MGSRERQLVPLVKPLFESGDSRRSAVIAEGSQMYGAFVKRGFTRTRVVLGVGDSETERSGLEVVLLVLIVLGQGGSKHDGTEYDCGEQQGHAEKVQAGHLSAVTCPASSYPRSHGYHSLSEDAVYGEYNTWHE